MPRKAWLLQTSRKVHLYFGLFISPALIFFAFTGALQTLGYHEASANYKPSAWMAALGQIHKKQTSVIPVRRNAAGDGARPDPGGARNPGAGSEKGLPTGPTPAEEPGERPIAGAGETKHPGSPNAGSPHLGSPHSGSPAATPDAFRSPLRPGAGPGTSPPTQTPQTLQAKQKQHLPLKIFFVLVSLGLFTSTLTGIYMAYKYDRNAILVTGLLLAGVVIPVLLLRF